MLSLKTALEGAGRCWWVAPTYPQSAIAWRELRALASQIPGINVREDARRIGLPGGGEITVKSADAPVSLKGEGLDLAVIDEAAYIDAEVWYTSLRPTLSDRQGKALIISTPNGYNWFYEAWQRGQTSGATWQSWQYPTSSNPLIGPAEIDAARESMPERVFRQEYLAEFVDAAGAVFRYVRDAATAEEQTEASGGHGYVIGVDWAGAGRGGDYTVFLVIDATLRAVAALDRFNGADFATQRERLIGLWERFDRCPIVAEQNSMGAPLIERLQQDGLPVLPFVTTAASKAQAVDALVLAFERAELAILDDAVLIGELLSFNAERLPSGLVRYAARTGHDDCVMALALAWHGMEEQRPLILWGDDDDD